MTSEFFAVYRVYRSLFSMLIFCSEVTKVIDEMKNEAHNKKMATIELNIHGSQFFIVETKYFARL